MAKKRNRPIYAMEVTTSNNLAQAKYKVSKMEDAAVQIGIAKVQITGSDPGYPLHAVIHAKDFLALGLSDEDHVYRDMKKITKTLPGHTYYVEDEHGISSYSIVPNADYIKDTGTIEIVFNNKVRKEICGLEGNYSSYMLALSTSFDNQYASRIYRILNTEAYNIPNEKDGYYELEYNLSEFKFSIGCANGDNKMVKDIIENSNNKVIDWDALYDMLPKKERMYPVWQHFKDKVLRPTQKEFKEKADITFEYEPIRKGNKTTGLIFKISRNNAVNDEAVKKAKKFEQNPIDPEKSIYALNKFYDEWIGHNELTEKDIDVFLLKAKYDFDKVVKAIEYVDSKRYTANYQGYIINAIENGYANTEAYLGNTSIPKLSKEMTEKINNASDEEKEEMAKKSLETIKQSENYQDFLTALENRGVYEATINMYSSLEILEMYGKYLRHENIM